MSETKTKLKLTEMEQKAYSYMKEYLDDQNDGFSDLVAEEISLEVSIPIKKLRGVLSSLAQKDLIYAEETTVNGRPHTFFHLIKDW